MHVIQQFAHDSAEATLQLALPFDQRCKSRFKSPLSNGEDCGVFLERGTVLRHGDRLRTDTGLVVAVVAAPEALHVGRSDDPLLIAKAAYHLGNRHVAIALSPGQVAFVADHVLSEMVRGLGLTVEACQAPFEPESGAYGAHVGHAHPHGHSSEGEGRGARIHDHFHDHVHEHPHSHS